MTPYVYVALGLVAGIFGGMFGLGGGLIVIPAMVYLFGFSQHQAQGTALAMMLPPVGILAVLRYYYNGNIKWAVAGFMCLGFIVGGLVGAHLAQAVPGLWLKRCFGALMLLVSLKLIIGK